MKRFMQADLFAQGALAVALANSAGQAGAAAQLATDYQAYADEGLSEQFELGAQVAVEALRVFHEEAMEDPNNIPILLLIYMKAMECFETSGKRKKRKLFGGTLFNFDHQPCPNRVAQISALVMSYGSAFMSSKIDFDEVRGMVRNDR